MASNRLLPGEDKAQDTGESLYTIALVEETLESSKATFMGLAEAPFRGTAVLLKKKVCGWGTRPTWRNDLSLENDLSPIICENCGGVIGWGF